MSAIWRIRDRATFDALRRSPLRSRRGPVRVSWCPDASGQPPRIAFAVGRKTGGAVVRNRLRRQARAHLAALDLAGGAYLVAIGPEAAGAPAAALRAALTDAVADLGRSGGVAA